MSATILLLEDDEGLRRILSRALASEGYQVRATAAPQTVLKWIREGQGDVLLADVLLDGHNFLEDLPMVHRLKPNLPVIVMSAQTTASMAIDAENSRVFEYLPKPFDLDDMTSCIASALNHQDSPRATGASVERTGLIGRSPAIQATFKAIARAARSQAHVTVTGESGTGKRQVAEALIQARGASNGGPRILTASHSAQRIFDESSTCGDVVWLRVDRWGQAQQRAARDALDCTEAVIVGTVAPGSQEMDTGLRARLGECVIPVPNLRERREDISALCDAFLLAFAKRDGGVVLEIDAEARSTFENADWPGNVAALKSAVSQLTFQVRGRVAGGVDASAAIASLAPGLDSTGSGLALGFAERILNLDQSRQQAVDELDAALLREALRRAGGNRSRAAELLGLNRNTLARRLSELGVEV
jgi:two-component system nitrogen regulation response regulator GlnG